MPDEEDSDELLAKMEEVMSAFQQETAALDQRRWQDALQRERDLENRPRVEYRTTSTQPSPLMGDPKLEDDPIPGTASSGRRRDPTPGISCFLRLWNLLPYGDATAIYTGGGLPSDGIVRLADSYTDGYSIVTPYPATTGDPGTPPPTPQPIKATLSSGAVFSFPTVNSDGSHKFRKDGFYTLFLRVNSTGIELQCDDDNWEPDDPPRIRVHDIYTNGVASAIYKDVTHFDPDSDDPVPAPVVGGFSGLSNGEDTEGTIAQPGIFSLEYSCAGKNCAGGNTTFTWNNEADMTVNRLCTTVVLGDAYDCSSGGAPGGRFRPRTVYSGPDRRPVDDGEDQGRGSNSAVNQPDPPPA